MKHKENIFKPLIAFGGWVHAVFAKSNHYFMRVSVSFSLSIMALCIEAKNIKVFL
ncbi:MAG: hypothetical protein OEY89_06375 [Gammaproteobacteria bacterium]|nr:hypothetical protein [Gammaproteobacteria bacterium]